jgi:putative transposase
MVRKLGLQYPGAIYHVMNRGDPSEDIFVDHDGRRLLLQTRSEACQKSGHEIQTRCWMRNHFHLVIETPCANLAGGMK